MKGLDRLFRIMAFGGTFATLALPPLMIALQLKAGFALLCTTLIAIIGWVGLSFIKKNSR